MKMNREQAGAASAKHTLLNVAARIHGATKAGYFHTGIHVSERTASEVADYLKNLNFTFDQHEPRNGDVFFHISW